MSNSHNDEEVKPPRLWWLWTALAFAAGGVAGVVFVRWHL